MKEGTMASDTFRDPLQSIQPLKSRLACPKANAPASHKVSVLHRVFKRKPYRLFGSPVPLQCCKSSLLGPSGSRLSPPSKENGSSSLELRTLSRDPSKGCPILLPRQAETKK
jgi:hypothetical protein